nr:hypothetical protein [Deltaproteobacteria bacterium]
MVKQRDPAAIAEEALGVKAGRTPKKVPFAFVLDELEVLAPTTRPMFGCTAIYVGPRIVLVLRDGRGTADDGVWIATTAEHHDSLRKELPSIRSITVFGTGERVAGDPRRGGELRGRGAVGLRARAPGRPSRGQAAEAEEAEVSLGVADRAVPGDVRTPASPLRPRGSDLHKEVAASGSRRR